MEDKIIEVQVPEGAYQMQIVGWYKHNLVYWIPKSQYDYTVRLPKEYDKLDKTIIERVGNTVYIKIFNQTQFNGR